MLLLDPTKKMATTAETLDHGLAQKTEKPETTRGWNPPPKQAPSQKAQPAAPGHRPELSVRRTYVDRTSRPFVLKSEAEDGEHAKKLDSS